MAVETITADKLAEREELLRLCLGMDAIRAHEYAQKFDDNQFMELINQIEQDLAGKGIKRPPSFPENYYGQFYTVKSGYLSNISMWQQLRQSILDSIAADPQQRAKDVLDYLLNQPNYTADFTQFKARFEKFRNALDTLLGYGLIKKDTVRDAIRYSLYKEIVPLVRDVLVSPEVKSMPVYKSEAAQQELEEVKKREQHFNEYLKKLLEERIEETLEFGRTLNIGFIAEYLEEMFGPSLYYDALLALAQQYAMTDTVVVNPEGGTAFRTGFQLALFGSPGTGKTFAVKDLMIGDPERGVKGHGLVEMNRYCGGVTPAFFIRIGEAYQGKRFNFVVTEFNDWFKYKGMVEPLKIALEQGEIRYETKTETVGPYRFSSFFSTNYNTKVEGHNLYRVTVSDPNFNAIEDRMVVRLHRMTKERFKELLRSQRDLAMGDIKMKYADAIRDHLTLVYAIQTEHELTKDRFKKKKIVIRRHAFEMVRKALDMILDQMRGELKFSPRVQHNALKLACAFTLPSFFAQPEEKLEVTEEALNLALKFLVEEIAVRQQVEIDTDFVLFALGISEINRFILRTGSVRAEVSSLEKEEAAEQFESKLARDAAYLPTDLRSRKRFRACEVKLGKEIGKPWEELQEVTRQFLVTGDLLLELMQQNQNGDVDYAPVIIEYSKALEAELAGRLFGQFREYLGAQVKSAQVYDTGTLEGAINPSDLRFLRTTLGIMRAYLTNTGDLTLGAILHFLRQAAHGEGSPVPIIKKFDEFLNVNRKYRSIVQAAFIQKLQKFTETFRNRAAHTSAMPKAEAESCRKALLSEGELLSFLSSAATVG